MPESFIYRAHVFENSLISTPDILIDHVYVADVVDGELQIGRVTVDRLTTDSKIQVLDSDTTADASVLLVASDKGMLIGLASNHRKENDRNAQLYCNLISRQIWRFEVVSEIWQEVSLVAYNSNGVVIQSGRLEEFLEIEKTISMISGGGRSLNKGSAVLCVGLPIKENPIGQGRNVYHLEMFCKKKELKLGLRYEVVVLNE